MVDWYDFDILWVGIVGRINLQMKLCQEINWLCLQKVQYCRRFGEDVRKKREIDAEIELDVIEKIRCRWMQTELLRC